MKTAALLPPPAPSLALAAQKKRKFTVYKLGQKYLRYSFTPAEGKIICYKNMRPLVFYSFHRKIKILGADRDLLAK